MKKKLVALLFASVLFLWIYVQGQLILLGFSDNSPDLQWNQWSQVLHIRADMPFVHPLLSDIDTTGYYGATDNYKEEAPLPVLSLDPSYAKRLKTLYAYDSFEGSPRPIWSREMGNESYSGTLSSEHVLDGETALRVELRKGDTIINGCTRSELALKISEEPLESHTYSVGILLPLGGTEDYAWDERGSEIILQWHNVPDAGEPWTTPPLALRTYNGRYVLERCWDEDPYSSDESMSLKNNRASYDLGPYSQDKGNFVQWKFRVKWGWLPEQEPILEVYKDGIQILDLNGLPNTTNDKRGVVMKIGLYKWDWCQQRNGSILDKRVIYYDRLVIE